MHNGHISAAGDADSAGFRTSACPDAAALPVVLSLTIAIYWMTEMTRIGTVGTWLLWAAMVLMLILL